MRDDRAGPPRADETILISLGWEEAWLAAGRLQSEGIPARVHPEMFSAAYGRALNPSADVVIPKDDVEQAGRILAELMEP